jgi:hypothetical protein
LTGVAVNVTDVPSQIVVVEAEIVTSGSTVVEVIVIGLLVAGPDAHTRSLVMMTVTTSPSCSVVVVKVGESVPAFTPLTCHW